MYSLEFVLHINNTSIKMLRDSIIDFGTNLEIAACREHTGRGMSLKININTFDPTIIFDTCAQFGRIKSVKVHQEKEAKCIL
ncbi:MAG: hypothetical protein V1650_03325 [Candidatus Omnitrophota bacterium]